MIEKKYVVLPNVIDIEQDDKAKFNVYWKLMMVEGKLKKCLTISNYMDEDKIEEIETAKRWTDDDVNLEGGPTREAPLTIEVTSAN